MKTKYTDITIKSIGYSLTSDNLMLSLDGFPYTMFCKPGELHYGGKNCEVNQLVVGGTISFDYTKNAARAITNVVITSDGVRAVDGEGNLIKW